MTKSLTIEILLIHVNQRKTSIEFCFYCITEARTNETIIRDTLNHQRQSIVKHNVSYCAIHQRVTAQNLFSSFSGRPTNVNIRKVARIGNIVR